MTDQEKAAYEFYRGDQWDSRVKAAREAAGRPVITFNRIASIVDTEAAHRNLYVTGPEWRKMLIAKVQEFRDLQRLVNIYASNLAELHQHNYDSRVEAALMSGMIEAMGQMAVNDR